MGDVIISNAAGALIGAQGTYNNSPVNVTVNHLSSAGIIQEGTTTIDRSSSHYFTGRETVLSQLAARLCPHPDASQRSDAKRKLFVLYGLPGVGKSQVCLKFVEKHRDKFWATFWVNCGNATTINKDFQAIARNVGLPSYGIDADARLGKHLLNNSKNWLLVLDNVTNHIDDRLRELIFPPGNAGTIIITTSLTRLLGRDVSYKIEKMDIEEGIDLLLKTADEQSTPETMEAAKPLVEELGCLPVALVQAGATMRTTAGFGPRLPLRSYMFELQGHKDRLMDYQALPGVVDLEPSTHGSQSVYSTFVVSRHMIETMRCSEHEPHASSDALDILDLCSRLHYEDIRLGMFRGISWRGGAPERTGWSDDRINRAVNLLASYSLIDLYNDKNIVRFSLNRLVHSWSDYHLRRYGTAEDQLWAKQTAMSCLVQSAQRRGRTADHYALRRSLYPHIDLALKSLGGVFRVTSKFEASMGHGFSAVFSENGLYSQAQVYLQKVLAWRQTNLRPDDPMIPDTACDLAAVLSRRGQYREALKTGELALNARLVIRGPHDPETLQAQTTVATALCGQGRFRNARETYADVLAIYRRLLGDDHPLTLEAMTNLASTLRDLGRLSEAVSLSRTVYQTHEIKLGPEHPETLQSLACLALSLEYEGTQLTESENLCQTSWDRHCKILGEHHPDTLTSLAQLARCHFKQGNMISAQEKYTEIQDARKKIMGPEHPDTIVSTMDLVELQLKHSAIDHETALTMYTNAIGELSKQWDQDHLYLLILKGNLAYVLKTLKQTSDAKNMYNGVLESYKSIDIPQHPEALKCTLNLAALLTSEGQLEEAEKLGRKAVAMYQATLGSQNRETFNSMRALGQTLAKARKYADAAVYVRDAVDGLRKVYGGDAPETLEAVAWLGNIEKRLGNREVSDELYMKAALGFKRLGRVHWVLRKYKPEQGSHGHEEEMGPSETSR